MTSKKPRPTFSLRAYRDMRTFVGELTAAAAGNEIALRDTSSRLCGEVPASAWAQLGKNHGIKVDGLVTLSLLTSSSRLQIVSLYTGWDAYIRALRAEYHRLFSLNWRHDDGDAPFAEIYSNTPPSSGSLKDRVGAAREQTLEYYRKVRNAVVHPSQSATAAATEHYAAHDSTMRQARSLYGMTSPPNQQDAISFHDVKLLARLILDVGAYVSECFDPGDSRLQELLPMNSWAHLRQNEQAVRAKAVGYLRNEFGLNSARARVIANGIAVP